MRCAVCNEPIRDGDEQYPNAWESTRKQFPCCGTACCQAFDPDEHWIPAERPPAADPRDEQRLLDVARRRVRDGDSPRVVLREMLTAGVSLSGLRKVMTFAQLGAERSEQDVKELRVMGAIAGLLTGRWFFARSTDKREPAELEAAQLDLDEWERRFGR